VSKNSSNSQLISLINQFLSTFDTKDDKLKIIIRTTILPNLGSQAVFFPSALVLALLSPLHDFLVTNSSGKKLIQKLDFLKELAIHQKSVSGSWNYYLRTEKTKNNLPDDLDTTCTMYLALQQSQLHLSGEQLSQLLLLLTNSEREPGGPYQTWLVSSNQSEWSDIDPTVNALVGALLQTQNVQLPGLNQFFKKNWPRRITSPYYLDDAITAFWLSSWWKSPSKIKLQRWWDSKLRLLNNNLELTVSSRCQLILAGLNWHLLNPSEALIFLSPLLQNLPLIKADPYCLHQKKYSQNIFLCSHQLDYAWLIRTYWQITIFLETQLSIKTQTLTSSEKRNLKIIDKNIMVWIKKLPKPISSQLKIFAQKLLKTDENHELTLWVTRSAKQICKKFSLNHAQLSKLNTAHFTGWLAYSVYNKVTDELATKGKECLPAANLALLKTSELWYQLGLTLKPPTRTKFLDFFHQAFLEMEKAHAVRLASYYHQKKYNSKIKTSTLVRQLSNRSLGHLLSIIFLLYHENFPKKEVLSWLSAGRYFLAAKQLADDLHDWELDWINKTITPVVASLRHSSTTMSKSWPKNIKTQQKIQSFFWTKVLPVYLKIGVIWLQKAQNKLSAVKSIDVAQVPLWKDINRLKSTYLRWENERTQTTTFLNHYNAPTPPSRS
jgi:hypothetical protein